MQMSHMIHCSSFTTPHSNWHQPLARILNFASSLSSSSVLKLKYTRNTLPSFSDFQYLSVSSLLSSLRICRMRNKRNAKIWCRLLIIRQTRIGKSLDHDTQFHLFTWTETHSGSGEHIAESGSKASLGVPLRYFRTFLCYRGRVPVELVSDFIQSCRKQRLVSKIMSSLYWSNKQMCTNQIDLISTEVNLFVLANKFLVNT